MKRRQFFGTTAALTVALAELRSRTLFALDEAGSGKGVDQYRDQIGIQLYTLRNQINDDVKSTIKAVHT